MDWYYKLFIVIGFDMIFSFLQYVECEIREIVYKTTFISVLWYCFSLYLLWNWIGS